MTGSLSEFQYGMFKLHLPVFITMKRMVWLSFYLALAAGDKKASKSSSLPERMLPGQEERTLELRQRIQEGRRMSGKIQLCEFARDLNQRGGAWETQLGAMANVVRLPRPFISFVFAASPWVLRLVGSNSKSGQRGKNSSPIGPLSQQYGFP